jgi:hypothetical protein
MGTDKERLEIFQQFVCRFADAVSLVIDILDKALHMTGNRSSPDISVSTGGDSGFSAAEKGFIVVS